MDEIIKKFNAKFPNLYIIEYNKNSKETVINKIINYIEIGTEPKTKSDGLKILANKLNIECDEILVIGNGDNDIEMFENFENSGCLKNGDTLAKKKAKYVSIKDNNNSGVEEIIKHYMKGSRL